MCQALEACLVHATLDQALGLLHEASPRAREQLLARPPHLQDVHALHRASRALSKQDSAEVQHLMAAGFDMLVAVMDLEVLRISPPGPEFASMLFQVFLSVPFVPSLTLLRLNPPGVHRRHRDMMS